MCCVYYIFISSLCCALSEKKKSKFSLIEKSVKNSSAKFQLQLEKIFQLNLVRSKQSLIYILENRKPKYYFRFGISVVENVCVQMNNFPYMKKWTVFSAAEVQQKNMELQLEKYCWESISVDVLKTRQKFIFWIFVLCWIFLFKMERRKLFNSGKRE